MEEDQQEVLKHHFCKFCNKRFPCGRSLGGHMRSHLINQSETHSNKMKKKNGKETSQSNNNTSPYVVDEQEEVALSLIMLSRNDNSSEFVKSSLPRSGSTLKLNARAELEASYEEFKKKTRFQCSACSKIFSSYQALGGHRASHRKAKECDEDYKYSSVELLAEKVEGSKKDMKDHLHECPICFKNFPSGQALGGHKRAHLIALAKTNQHIEIQKPAVLPETRHFLDLNLPAPMEEDDDHRIGFQATANMITLFVGPTF